MLINEYFNDEISRMFITGRLNRKFMDEDKIINNKENKSYLLYLGIIYGYY